MIKIIDNFLPYDDYKQIYEVIMHRDFPWYFNNCIAEKTETNIFNYQFTHIFYNYYKINSDKFHILNPIIDLLKPAAIIRIKANLLTITENPSTIQYHRDFDYPCLTAIYYLNTTNGCTLFKEGKPVDCIANRMVIFDTSLIHSSTKCTDVSRRCVINFNYFGELPK